MGGDGDQGSLGSSIQSSHDVAFAVDGGMPAQRAELRDHPFGALLFQKSG